MEWSRQHARYEARLQDPAPAGPPLPEQVDLRAAGGSHNLRIRSDDFEELVSPILLYEDKRIPVLLRARPAMADPIAFESVPMGTDLDFPPPGQQRRTGRVIRASRCPVPDRLGPSRSTMARATSYPRLSRVERRRRVRIA
jgi:hypothetical protein